MVSVDKDPKKVRAGLASARSRWGEKRVIRLDELTPERRRLVIALVEAVRSEQPTNEETAAVSDDASDGLAEVQRGSAERSAA